MASRGAILAPAAFRLLRMAVHKTSLAVRNKLADAARPFQHQLQPIPLHSRYVGRQPVHPAALLKRHQRGNRWFSGAAARSLNVAVRRFVTGERTAGHRIDRFKLPSSNTSQKVAQIPGRAPFANALRPNLTGGALPRAAGGYGLGGGARYFSHTPAAPAQVVQNVTQAMRAFFISGQKVRYDGAGPRGERLYRAVSAREVEVTEKLAPSTSRCIPGSFVDYATTPIITALSPLATILARDSRRSGFGVELTTVPTSLDTAGFLDVLTTDFDQAYEDWRMIVSDLRRLSALGALPVTMEPGGTIRVRFPGVDAETLERLCDDLAIQRGIIGQDVEFDDAAGTSAALKFPFVPDTDEEQTFSSPGGSIRSLDGLGFEEDEASLSEDSFVADAYVSQTTENQWLSVAERSDGMSRVSVSQVQRSEDSGGLEAFQYYLETCARDRRRPEEAQRM